MPKKDARRIRDTCLPFQRVGRAREEILASLLGHLLMECRVRESPGSDLQLHDVENHNNAHLGFFLCLRDHQNWHRAG